MNSTIEIAIANTKSILTSYASGNVACSVSGGSDSDCVIDMLEKCKPGKMQIRYFWIDTGIEYKATKDHLNYLEAKYKICIERIRSIKSIPVCCKEYGQPFISKYVSAQCYSLQRNGFKWENKPVDVLLKEYPSCQSAIKWWCNYYTGDTTDKSTSIYNIAHNNHLKEFIISNPPTFKISGMCCDVVKKITSRKFVRENKIDLLIMGLRRAEGGVRSVAYKSCYTASDDSYDTYRPVFFFTDKDKEEYKEAFDIKNSDCYERYGMTRTGCAGCPFALDLEDVLKISEVFEPDLNKVCKHIFADSYEYTRQYKLFAAERRTQYLKERSTVIEQKKKELHRSVRNDFWREV